jgi:hypothetical protein
MPQSGTTPVSDLTSDSSSPSSVSSSSTYTFPLYLLKNQNKPTFLPPLLEHDFKTFEPYKSSIEKIQVLIFNFCYE